MNTGYKITINPLLKQIFQGESKTLEFKQELPTGLQLAKTVVAFANTAGGKLVIGVNDQRSLVGLGNCDVFELMDQVSSILHDLCQPTLLPEIYVENIDGYELLIIDVSRGALLPYYLKNKGKEQGCYVRLGATNRQAGMNQFAELERQRLNICFDEQICYDVPLQSLNLKTLCQRFEQAGKALGQEQLLNLKLIRDDQGTLYPTHGLLILLGYYEHVEIKCGRFKGTTMTVFLDKKEFAGDLFSQLEQAELFIKNHLQLKVEIKGLQRTETYELPMPAIREALLNAFIHRDYSNFGRDIKLGIYDDILNIVSPGALPNGLTPHDLTKGRSEVRNRTLARVFKALGFVEQWGSGIQRIYEICDSYGVGEPILSENGDFIDWAFPRPGFIKEKRVFYDDNGHISYVGGEEVAEYKVGSKAESEAKSKVESKVESKAESKVESEAESKVENCRGLSYTTLSMIKNNANVTLREIAAFSGKSISGVEKAASKLRKEGKIQYVGPKKGGHWEVTD